MEKAKTAYPLYTSYTGGIINLKILGTVVPEKYLAEKKFTHKLTDTHTHTHTHRKGKNYIPPIYFVYRGYNYSQHLSFVFSNTFGCPHHVYKI